MKMVDCGKILNVLFIIFWIIFGVLIVYACFVVEDARDLAGIVFLYLLATVTGICNAIEDHDTIDIEKEHPTEFQGDRP